MIRPRLLIAHDGGPLSFDTTGEPAESVTSDAEAVMVVGRVTDALKVVTDGMVLGPIDRDAVSRVVSFSVSRDLLERLGDGAFDAAGLIEAVRGLGVDWALVSQDELLRPLSAQ